MHGNNGERYFIKMVGDDALPGKDWAFVECEDGEVWLAIKRSHISEHVLESAWAAFRALERSSLSER